MTRFHRSVVHALLGFASVLVVIGVVGCATPVTVGEPTTPRDARFLEVARLYREGEYEKVWLPDLLPYFQARLGKIRASEVRQLLGEPRVVSRDDGYYDYALIAAYGYADVEDPDFRRKHDEVWHYGETGPPHRIPDESANLFFVIKDGIVIAVRDLA